MVTYYLWRSIVIRSEVEDTRLEAKAKDTKKFWGQGQTLSRPRPRTKAQVFSKKRSSKIFFQAISTWGKQKKIFAKFLAFFNKIFNGSKNSAVLEPRTEQFSRTWGQGQGLQNLSSRPRTSSRTPPLIVILIHKLFFLGSIAVIKLFWKTDKPLTQRCTTCGPRIIP